MTRILPMESFPLGLNTETNNKSYKIKNLIFIRFFIKNNATELFKNKLSTDEDIYTYLCNRVKIFQKITWSSLKNTITSTDQIYLLVTDEYKKFLFDLLPQSILKSVIIINLTNNTVINMINDYLLDHDIVTITRLDNDDALSKDFFDVLNMLVSNLVESYNFKIISFIYGMQLKNNIFSVYLFTNNHFISTYYTKDINWLNQKDSLIHLLSFNHSYLYKQKNLITISTNVPMWLEYIHDSNQRNRFNNNMILHNYKYQDRFNIVLDVEKTLNELGSIYGTDKNSCLHNYLNFYEKFFQYYKNNQFNLIEVGVYNCASIKMWLDYFKKAKIIGIDINKKEFHADRFEFFHCDASDPMQLIPILIKYPPFIFIDDGSHKYSEQIATFETTFPYLQHNGIYICEDIHTSFGKYRNNTYNDHELDTASYFVTLSLLSNINIKAKSDHYLLQNMTALQKHFSNYIDYIIFRRHCVLIRKK